MKKKILGFKEIVSNSILMVLSCAIPSFIITFLVMYPTFSFIHWNLSPMKWDYASRLITGIFFIILVIYSMFTEETEEE